jgi:diaminopimelate epimerase
MINTQFHGNAFLFINKDASEFPLVTNQDVDLTMYYEKLLLKSNETHKTFQCTFFNKDGSKAELCGNALFALMKQEGLGEYMFDTIAGEFYGIYDENEMKLRIRKNQITESNDHIKNCQAYWWRINIGNTHHIILHNKMNFKECCEGMKYDKVRINTHILYQKNTNTFEVRCFERGVGETQACGSGAYAVGVAMMKHFNLDEVKIVMKGGEYTVKKDWLIVKI